MQPTPLPSIATPEPVERSDGPVTITFGVERSAWETYTPLIQTFHATHPDIRVQLVNTQPLIDAYFASIDAGQADPATLARDFATAADTFSSEWILPPYAPTFTTNLRPFMDSDPAFAADDFFPLVADLLTQPHVDFVPAYIDARLLLYNRTLLEAEGIPLPDASIDWNGMMALAERLAQRTPERITRYGLAEMFLADSLAHELAAQNMPVDWFQQPLDPAQQQQVETLITTLTRRSTDGTLLASSSTNLSGNDTLRVRDQVLRQEIALWDGNLLFDVPLEKIPFALGALPPLDPQDGFDAYGYAMSAGTRHPQATWQWVSFLSRQPPPAAWRNIPASRIPARRSLAEQTGYWSRMDATMAATMRQITDQQRMREARNAAEDRMLTQVASAIGSVAQQRQSVAQALADLRTTLTPSTTATEPTLVPAPVVVATPLPDVVAAPGAEQVRFGVTTYRTTAVRQTAQQVSHDTVAVQVQDLPPGQLAAIADQVDCFSAVASLEETDALLDLRPLLDADARNLLGDLPAVVRQRLERDGRLYGLPLTVGVPTLNGNQALLDAAGVTLPDANATPADLLATAQRLTSGDGPDKQYGYAAAGTLIADLDWWLRRSGVSLVDATGQPDFTTPATRAAVASFLTLVRDTSPHTRLTGLEAGVPSQDGVDAIMSGRVALWLGLPSAPPVTVQGGAVVRGVAPTGTGGLTSADLDVRGGYVSATTAAVTGCWAMLTALSATTVEIATAPGGPLVVPARTSVAMDAAFTSTLGDDGAALAEAATAALTRASAQPPTDADVPRDWFYRAVDAALQGEDLTQALTNAQERTDGYLACVAGGTAPETCLADE